MLKNYTSTARLDSIFREIQKTLSEHHAKQVMFNYDDKGRVVEVAFIVDSKAGPLAIRLPAKFDQVKKIFDANGYRYKEDQPYRTAWATIRDWLTSQMALLDWEMVKMEEVFLPYIVDKYGKTLFESLENSNFLLPEGGDY